MSDELKDEEVVMEIIPQGLELNYQWIAGVADSDTIGSKHGDGKRGIGSQSRDES